MSAEKSVLTIDRPAEGIARIGLNRPEKRNALDPELRLALIDGIEAVLEDSSVRAVILAGNGGHFCAGGDIASMEGLDAAAGRARMKSNHRMVRLIADAEKPVVAAIEGYAVGAGAGIALLADTVVIAETGAIGFPFFKVGLIPDYAILHTLPRRRAAGHGDPTLRPHVAGRDAVEGDSRQLAPEGGTEPVAGTRPELRHAGARL